MKWVSALGLVCDIVKSMCVTDTMPALNRLEKGITENPAELKILWYAPHTASGMTFLGIGTVTSHLYILFYQHVHQESAAFAQAVQPYFILGLRTSDETVVGGTGVILETMTIAFKLFPDFRTDVFTESAYVQWMNSCVNVCHDSYNVTYSADTVNPNRVLHWRRISGRKISGQYLQIPRRGF